MSQAHQADTDGFGISGYAVCGEPRSGSTYLTRVLASTDVLGRPVEFDAADLTEAAERGPDGALPPKVEKTRTPNGVYGLKVFSHQFDVVTNARWAANLPGLQFIHLDRLDLLGQAISHVRALQTNRYESAGEPQRAPHYDDRAIGRMMMQIAHNQARWRVWFARNGLTVLRLTYEEVVRDPQEAAEAVARHVGILTVPRVDLSRVAMAIQRDALSDLWRQKFLAQRRDLGYLDDHFWGVRAKLRRWYAAIR